MPEKTKPASRRPVWFVCAGVLLVAAAVGGWHYYMSGRLQLAGVLQSNVKALASKHGGQITEVAAVPGSRVREGETLIRFDEAALRASLMREEQELQSLAMLVPPHLLRAPGPDGGLESLAGRLERQRLAEEAAEARLRDFSDQEAQAAVLYSRATMLVSQGKLSRQELDGAEAHAAAARKAAQEARQSFETLSLERAATGAEIRRMRDMQSLAGADGTPEEARLQSFERKKAHAAELRAALAAAVISAPADGVVVDVAVRPGDRIAPMQPCLLFRPDGLPPQVRILTGGGEAGGIRTGQQCRLRIAGSDEAVFEGFVAALTPGLPAETTAAPEAGGAFSAVWIGFVSPGGIAPELALLEDGVEAKVTVLLRAPLISPLPSAGYGMPSGTAVTGEPAAAQPVAQDRPEPAAPVEGPLSVQTPYGGDPVQEGPAPVVRQGVQPVSVVVGSDSPEAAEKRPQTNEAPETARKTPQTPPQLPPMRAPHQLTGSPHPDPRNNPSLVPPHVLEGEAHTKP